MPFFSFSLISNSPFSPLLLLLSLLSFFSSIFMKLKKKKMSKLDDNHPPPSPLKLPIIGNLHQLGRLPHRSLRDLSSHHGPLMLLHLGRIPLLVASSPSAAREILRTHDNHFADRWSLTASRIFHYDSRDVAFARYSDYWREARKAAVIHLLSSKKVHSYRLAREEEVAAMVERVRRAAAASTAVDVGEELNVVAMNVSSRAVVGEPARGSWWGKGLKKLVEDSSSLSAEFFAGDYVPWMGWTGRVSGFLGRARRAFDEANGLLDGIVEERRERRKKEKRDEEDECFLDVLLSLEEEMRARFKEFDDDCIKAIIKDMVGAGTGSTSAAMEWVMAELIRNPRTMRKLKEEITKLVGPPNSEELRVREEHLADMIYLKAAIKEALRLHPPAPLLVPRRLMEDAIVGGYRVPKGAMTLVNVWAIGRDPDIWDTPDEFQPERFINGKGGADLDLTGRDFLVLPFGAGRRACPGIQFSMMMIELAIANLVYKFEWKSSKGEEKDTDMGEAFGLVTRKRGGLLLHATKAY
ncbi:Cytochrome P450 71A4 [Apostasia shenzhenica]|uniref:Cytochrome P450 71A4 n=1 Tax=Apostasia shenzhenica TaxID=1088818 RepID=A0A2H9ZS78_9ASPA|nr:Cytochrome P450 71A4 [Apostasia shenzhenica]